MSSLHGIYNTVRDMKPGNGFNILVAQIIFKQRILEIKSSKIIYAIENKEIEPVIQRLSDFCFDQEHARMLVNQLPKLTSFSISWMRFSGKTTYTCIIDDSADAKSSRDVIYIDIHEEEEPFCISKSILLWKIRSMINSNEDFNIDDYWVEKSQNESN